MNSVPNRYIWGNITWYSLLITIGIAIAIILASSEERRKHLQRDIIIDVSVAIIPSGIIGARLYYIAFNLDYFWHNPLEIFKIWRGGLAIYGAIIMAGLVCYAICRYKRIPFLSVLDCIAPGLALAQSIGRWGNFFNSEAYGRQIIDRAWQFFPYAVYINGKGYYMATFFYESVCTLIIFIYLWLNRKSISKSGDIFFRYIAMYGTIRTFIEGLRSDSLYIGNIRVSQMLSIILVILVLCYFIYRLVSNRIMPSILQNISIIVAICVFIVAFICYMLYSNDLILILALFAIIFGLEAIYIVLKENKI